MQRPNRSRWYVYAEHDGTGLTILPQPTPTTREHWRRILTLPREYSGDGNWLEVRHDDGTVALVLIRLAATPTQNAAA